MKIQSLFHPPSYLCSPINHYNVVTADTQKGRLIVLSQSIKYGLHTTYQWRHNLIVIEVHRLGHGNVGLLSFRLGQTTMLLVSGHEPLLPPGFISTDAELEMMLRW